MNKGLKVLGFALMLAVAVAAVAADASYPKVGKVWHISFIKPVRVGAAMLPAGDYNVQHLIDGDHHVLVFTNGDKHEKARVSCTVEPLPGKVARNFYGTTETGAGENVLQWIEFAGDSFRHATASQ